ncbi:hypothetical protein GCM10023237_65650 [Streptomyces coeruleoprunus]
MAGVITASEPSWPAPFSGDPWALAEPADATAPSAGSPAGAPATTAEAAATRRAHRPVQCRDTIADRSPCADPRSWLPERRTRPQEDKGCRGRVAVRAVSPRPS